MTKKTYKLDIFKVLAAINKKETTFLSQLDELDRKAFVPYLTQRWLSGVPSKRQVIFINTLVNPFIFSLYKHPELLFLLLTICTNGKQQQHSYYKTKPSSNHPKSVEVLKRIYNYSTQQAVDALKILQEDDVLEIADELGYQKEQIKEIKNEWKQKER